MPGVQVAAVARKHGATRWQVYDWRRRLVRDNWHCRKAWRRCSRS
ncbi:hypothetical protein NKI74_21470 [Mesorhizobium sp. M0494]